MAKRGRVMNETAARGRDLVFTETTGPVPRVILAVAGCVTLLAPWELLLRPGLHPFQWGMLPFWALSAGALAIGVPCFLGAILGPSRTLHFDAERRKLIERGRLAIGFTWARAWDFDDLGTIVVDENAWSDGPSTWVVDVAVPGRPTRLRVVDVATEARAEVIAADLERLVRG